MTKVESDEGNHEEAMMQVVRVLLLLRAPARMHVHTFRMSIGVPPAANLGGSAWVCSGGIERMRDRKVADRTARAVISPFSPVPQGVGYVLTDSPSP